MCEPGNQCLYSRPEAQDVSKSLLLELAGPCSCLLSHTPHPLPRHLQALSPLGVGVAAVFRLARLPFSALAFLLLSLPFFTSCGERCFHSKAVLKPTGLIQSCDSCHHHLGAVSGISGAEQRGEGEQEHSRVAAQRRESRKQKVGTAGMCCHAEREHQRKHEWLLTHSGMEK